jgi:archaellum component FlaC
MTNTPIQINIELKEYLESIRSDFAKVEQKLERIDEKLERMDEKFEQKFERLEEKIVTNTVVIERLSGEINTLRTEVTGINRRIDSQEFLNRGVAIGLIVALCGGFLMVFLPNFPSNP